MIVCIVLAAIAGFNHALALSVSVSTWAELHAALGNHNLDTIIISDSITVPPDTNMSPNGQMASAKLGPAPPASAINRSLSIGADPAGPHLVLDCGLVQHQYTLGEGVVLNLSHIILRNCTGVEELMLFAKADNATVVLNDVLEDRGSSCAPAEVAMKSYSKQPRPIRVPGAAPAEKQRLNLPAAGGSKINWCNREPQIIPQRSLVSPIVKELCTFQPLILQDVALHREKQQGELGSWILVYRNVIQVTYHSLNVCRVIVRGMYEVGPEKAARLL
jgi:hypothetical protein